MIYPCSVNGVRARCVNHCRLCFGIFVDEIDLKKQQIDVFITASQKALALPPGLSIVVCGKQVLENRIYSSERKRKNLYLDLSAAFIDGQRGQTPFTPALTIIYQLAERINEIQKQGGVEAQIARSKQLASYFREQVSARTPFTVPNFQLSNGLTPLQTGEIDAYELFLNLMQGFNQVITPCGGIRAKSLTRVGHMGYLEQKDYDYLLDCMVRLI